MVSAARIAMWLAGAAAVAGVVGCGQPHAAAVSNVGSGATAPPTSPPPTVSYTSTDNDFGTLTWTGLPAASADGQAVMLPVVDDDGARGMPNLALVERGRDDRALATRVVLALPTGDQEPAAPHEPAGLVDSNRWLAERHRQRDWRPLTALGAPDPASEAPDYSVAKDGVVVRWADGHLVVIDHGATVVDAQHADWLVKPYPMCASCADTCDNPSMLGEVSADLAHHLLVVKIRYRGNDSCWEPTSQLHVVSW
jgi:hypothetical protein